LIGDGGILLPHDDNAAWTKTVRTVFHDAVEWQRLSRAARRNSLHRRFSLENTLTKYENFLSACVEDHTLPRIAEPRYREEPLLGLREELSA
jgi:glycosyltransferase involved in cell wall biosynthesis